MSKPQVNEICTTAGEMLKKLRLEKDLSVEDIAVRMHLGTRIIEALESNNFADLPAATYVRGYLRSYAKFVAADVDAIITLYDKEAPDAPEIIPDVRHSSQLSSSDKPVKAFTYLISFIMVILLLAWLQSNYIVRDYAIESSPENTSTKEGSMGLNESFTIVNHPDTPLYGDADESAELNEIKAPNDNVSSDTSLALAADKKLEPLETPEMSGSDTIILTLTADSWINITDSNDDQLYYDLARSGEKLSLRGTAPFQVKLGFSQGVQLEFNGKSFDAAPFSHAGVAKFTLGE